MCMLLNLVPWFCLNSFAVSQVPKSDLFVTWKVLFTHTMDYCFQPICIIFQNHLYFYVASLYLTLSLGWVVQWSWRKDLETVIQIKVYLGNLHKENPGVPNGQSIHIGIYMQHVFISNNLAAVGSPNSLAWTVLQGDQVLPLGHSSLQQRSSWLTTPRATYFELWRAPSSTHSAWWACRGRTGSLHSQNSDQ